MSEATLDFSTLLHQAKIDAISVQLEAPLAKDCQPLLNGMPYRMFRQSENVVKRRIEGTFFSGPRLARELVRLLKPHLDEDAIVLDPTCGLGDLLLAYAEILEIAPTLAETLEHWGNRLAGIELREDLVEMTKARLVLLARARGGFKEAVGSVGPIFPKIVVGSMFTNARIIGEADGFLFNPPFGQTTVHDVTQWGAGQINAAALCLDKLVLEKRRSAPIAAVLPEVLRCGTRYARFRERLEAAGLCGAFTSMGRFDAWTDVDVFTSLVHDAKPGELWRERSTDETAATQVADYFDVRVGTVVPHRHKKLGPWQRFICAKTVPAWTSNFVPQSSRRYQGSTFAPPFVVVRRTSGPRDRQRAVGAIILGDRPVAVENHLIVLLPHDNAVSTCEELLAILSAPATSEFLNRTIRCRHLTTKAVKEIPWQVTGE